MSFPTDLSAVLFDAGGVLLDLDYAYLGRLIEPRHGHVDPDRLARAEAVARRDVDRMIQGAGPSMNRWREYFHLILAEVGVPGAGHDPIIDALWQAHGRVGLWTVAVEGSLEAVDEVRRSGLRTAVVSNAEGQVARDLDNAGYDGRFEVVVDSHLVGVSKPDPGIFRIALERLGLTPDRVIYVGDLPAVDVVGARAAGIEPVLLDRHDMYEETEVSRLRSLSGLPRLLSAAQNSDA